MLCDWSLLEVEHSVAALGRVPFGVFLPIFVCLQSRLTMEDGEKDEEMKPRGGSMGDQEKEIASSRHTWR